MPKRIGFHVIYATSEESGHLASELGWAGPATRGWRSTPNTRAPHELVLQLECRVAITRVQLLAHQTLIPERVELLVHDSASSGGAPRTPSSPQYCGAGWVGLAPPAPPPVRAADGAGQAAKSRELRTAALPKIPATYVRLRLSQPHLCQENKFNQVSLMGVNVFGIPFETNEESEVPPEGDENYSPYDDLAFVMYVDSEIAQIIRQLEVKKQEAIKVERFEYARKLKAACVSLCSGGRALGALQLQKRLAAAAEQYERASRKRDAIATGRTRLALALRLHTLLETDGMDPSNDEYSEEIAFNMDMLTQPTNHLSFDAPSPPTVMPPLSSKDSSASFPDKSEAEVRLRNTENTSTYVNTIPKHDRNSLIMDENKVCFLNGLDDTYPPQNENNYPTTAATKHSNYTDNDSKFETNENCNGNGLSSTDGTMSPQLKTQKVYTESNYRSNLGNHISNSENDLIDGSSKIYFEDQVSHNTAFGSSGDVQYRTSSPQLRNGVGGRDQIMDYGGSTGGGRMAICEGSYFNSPANSVSPTNMQYNTDICRNGEASPISRPHGMQSASPVTGGCGGMTGNVPGVVRRRNKSAGPTAPTPHHHRSSTTYEAYEERLLPALRHSHTNEFLRGCQTEPTEPARGRPRMGERDRKQAALPILIFGEELVEKFYSKHFAEKEEGLQNLKSVLRCFDTKVAGPSSGRPATVAQSPNKAARAATLLLHRALRDPVHSVYSLAADTTRIFFQDFIQRRVNAAEIGRCLEKLVPELLTRAGDPAPRVHSLAMHTLLTMADCPSVRSLNLIPAYLVRPLTAGTAPRLALSRLLMVEQLLLNHGIDKNSGLRGRCVAELGAGGLTHGQGGVRRAAERLLLAAYQRAPRMVRAQLPPDDPVTRRNLIYRHLFEGFDRIDRRKQDELMGISQCEDPPSERTYYDPASLKMSDSMMTSQITPSQMTTSHIATSQMSASMTQSISGTSMSSSMTSSMYQPKSSMKKIPTRKYTSAVGFNGVKGDVESPGYNKLRLDSAVSPKHQPKLNKAVQNPRNYVLEKNWQNSIMQNGNYCPQEQDTYRWEGRGKKNEVIEDKYKPNNTSSLCEERPKTAKQNDNRFREINQNYDGRMSINGSMTNLNNGSSSHYKNKIIARNLHSNIVFDSKTSYSDGENATIVENGIKKMQITENENSEVDNIIEKDYDSPGGTLKRNKNAKNSIYRSKSGSHVPTCYDDENFDSFDDSQVEIDAYEYYKEEDGCNKQDLVNMEVNHFRSESRIATVTERTEELDESSETQCPFCLCLVSEGALDSHYWKSCPLLGRCHACRGPLQIKDLNSHLASECPHSSGYRLCPRCTEAINVENYQRHIADNDCLETSDEFWKCPLCHSNVSADEDNWRNHLTADGSSDNCCTMNPRSTPVKHTNKAH